MIVTNDISALKYLKQEGGYAKCTNSRWIKMVAPCMQELQVVSTIKDIKNWGEK